MIERWTALVLRARSLVLLGWLAVLAAGVLALTQFPGLLSNSFAVPGTESERARELLGEHFGERPDGTFVVVFRGGGDPAALRRAAARVPGARVGRLRRSGGIAFAEVATSLDLHRAKALTGDLRAVLGPAGALVTGQPALQHDLDPILAADLRRGEAVALPFALAVLLLVFGLSVAVAVPFVFAACTIFGAYAALYVVAHATPTATYVTNLVGLIGLGLAVDYSLLLVHRFREERAGPGGVDDAVVRTMAGAGRAVVVSGIAVAIGLALLLLVPVPFVRSLGLGGLLVPLVAIAGAVTLQPVLLSLLGSRIAPARTGTGGFWAGLARVIMRRPKTVLAVSAAALLAAATPTLGLELVPGSFASIPASTESSRGLALLSERVGAGALTPTHVVVETGGDVEPARAAVSRLVDALTRDPEVYVVASGRRAPYAAESGRYLRVIVAGRHEYGERASRDFVQRLRERHIPGARFPAGATVTAGGAPPQGVDFLDAAYGAFPWLVLAVLVATYLVLLAAFRSLLLPLKAVLLNLLTVLAVYGVLSTVYGEVEAWIPIVLFAMLFGLSMDYEVFLVMRMRESWDHVHDNVRAVSHGLARTGRVITAAALIMVAAFSGFFAGRIAGLEQLGLGLALGVALDATIVRALLVPSLMAVLGRWNWWLPGGVRNRAGLPEQPRTGGPPT